MNRKKLCILFLCVSCFLAACGKDEDSSDLAADSSFDTQDTTENTVQEGSVAYDPQADTETPSGDLVAEKYGEGQIDLTNYSLDDADATDFLWDYGAAVEDGYYYFEYEYLYFYDLAAGMSVPLCNRADCRHDTYDCNAFYNYGEYASESICYYDGYLYTITVDSDSGNVNLCRIAPDGSSRDDSYMTLYSIASDESGAGNIGYPSYCIMDGMVYFTFKQEAVPKIRCMELGSSKSEVVFTSTGIRPEIYRLQHSGDYLFFQSGNYTDEDCIDIEGGIFALNSKTGEYTLVKKDAISNYTVQNDTLYYAIGGEIYGKSLVGESKETLLLDTGQSLPTFDVKGETLCVWNEDNSTLIAYDLAGNEINRLKDKRMEDCYFGDDRNYIAYEDAGDHDEFYILNLEDFFAGGGAWERLI